MAIEKRLFGYAGDDREIYRFIITNSRGNKVSLLNYGCIIQSIQVKDQSDEPVDVVLGFDTVEDYDRAGGFIGAVVGRTANRITGGCFTMDGRAYPLYQNDGKNHLHGGKEGFSKKVWDHQLGEQDVCFQYISRNLEEGYPGDLFTTVHYIWTDDDTLIMEISYIADQKTPVNITNHSYFNLNGAGRENAMEQELTIYADYYTPVDQDGLVTGEIRRVDGTNLDFRTPRTLLPFCADAVCHEVSHWDTSSGTETHPETTSGDVFRTDPQLLAVGGFDHNLVLSGRRQILLRGRDTGICMDLDTDSPGIQLYSGNYLRESTGKGGMHYGKRSGVCLEPQYFPNSVNISHFPSPFVEKNQWKKLRTEYHFYISNEENTNNQEGLSNE